MVKNKQLSPWEALDLEMEQPGKQEHEKERIQIKRRFQECFTSTNGKWVLEYLNGRYFNKPVVDEHHVNPLAHAGIREGELRLLRFIHLMMVTEK